MDLKAMMDGKGWTEELHTSFLTSMEETFVREMLTCAGTGIATASEPPLDRHVPDSGTESNRRFQSGRFTPSPPPPPPKADQEILPGIEDSVLANRQGARKRPLSLCDVSQDQVVPKLGGKEEDAVVSNKAS